jgi:hypothetical protein
VGSLWVASAARASDGGGDPRSTAANEFRMPDGSGLRTPHPISKAAMAVLAKHWPAPIPFSDLSAMAAARLGLEGDVDEKEAAVLAADMLKCFCAGAAELHALGPRFVTGAGAVPEAFAMARLQAARGAHVTNMRHEMVSIDDANPGLLALLDGSRERAALAAAAFPAHPASNANAALDEALARLARQALLVQ